MQDAFRQSLFPQRVGVEVGPVDTTEMLELSQEFALLGVELHGDGDNQAALHR
ncbi:MAG: hypothetical protein QOE53_1491, partial [Pseudonocardiales bacterium]|nr:hypothetical protein [Pseudonocardiales bacterium]